MRRTESSQRNGPGPGDRGIAVVFFAISVTAMLAVGALVLGGSVGYAAVRNAQTAADSAALAGASALNDHKENWSETSADDLVEAVRTSIEGNGGTYERHRCELVTAEYGLSQDDAAVIPAYCDEIAGLDEEVFQSVAGVRVTVSDTRDVPFAAFVDQDTITGTAVASATIQAVVESRARAPFMLCAGPVEGEVPTVEPDTEDLSGYKINVDAVGRHYVLWGNQIKNRGRDCGNGSSDWRGLVQFGGIFPIPSGDPNDDSTWWKVEHGNKKGHLFSTPRTVAGTNACVLDGEEIDELTLGCRIAIPLCPKSNEDLSGKSGDLRLYCVKIGLFEISHIGEWTETLDAPDDDTPCGSTKKNIICGKFLGNATVLNGQGAVGTTDPFDSLVVKLVE